MSDSSTPSPRWTMNSKVEATRGPLRAAMDGTIVEGQLGDLVSLDVPEGELQQYYTEVDKHAATRKIAMPEMKNGATAEEDPRARKPISRVIKNWWTGSSRPPKDEPMWIFSVSLDRKPRITILEELVATRRHQGGADVRHKMIKILKAHWGYDLSWEYGENWAVRADENDELLVEIEDFVVAVVQGKTPPHPDDEFRIADTPVVEAPAVVSEAPKKKGWLW